jgi:hypothetical protein
MHKTFVSMVVVVLALGSLAGLSFADDNSDCLSGCANDKRSSDMYCAPAGGYSEDDHRQCVEKNTTTYNDCVKACLPQPAVPAPPAPVTAPAGQPEEQPAGDK